MDDVKTALRPLQWSTTVRIIDKNSLFPMVVKPTHATAEIYEISEDPILLHNFWITQRIIGQSLEDEGAYVVGPQLEIPAEFTGTFQYRQDQKGNDDVVQVFPSVREIAMSMPEKVFTQERLVVYPQAALEDNSGEKVPSLILEQSEKLTVIEKKEVYTMQSVSRFVFSGKPKYKYVPVACVSFLVDSTKETINLPLSTKGNFCTLSHVPSHNREFNFNEIISEIDFPINLTTFRNCPQTSLDEHHLRHGMRLRLTAIEEHEVIIGVTTQKKIVEFAADNVEFLLPKHLDFSEDQEIDYQTALQRFLMECQIKNSPVNMKDYRKSIRTHISRSVRPTAPTALSQVARNRVCKFTSAPKSVQSGMPAIAFFSSSNNSPGVSRRSSLPTNNQRSQRHSMPLPAPPLNNQDNPPLPPRNSRGRSSFKATLQSPNRPLSARPVSTIGFEHWDDFPTRPPPPLPESSFERPKSSSVGSFTDTSPSNTSSAASPDEQIWKTLDEHYLKKLRGDCNSVEKGQNHSSYENVTLHGKDQGKEESTTIGDALPPTILSRPNRTDSPEFILTDDTVSLSVNNLLEGPLLSSVTVVEETVVDNAPEPVLSNGVQSNGNADQQEKSIKNQNYENFSPINVGQTDSKIDDQQVVPTAVVDDTQITAANNDSAKEEEYDHDSAVLQDNLVGSSFEHTRSISNEESEHSASPDHTTSSSNSSPQIETNNGYFHVSQYSVSEDSNLSSTQHASFTCNYAPSPENWVPPDDLSHLTVTEIADSLRYIGMNEDTVEWFRAEKVDGHLLCSIGDEEFTQHFRLTPFQQKKIAMFLKGWRPKIK